MLYSIYVYIAISYLLILLISTMYYDRKQFSVASFIIVLYLISIIGSLFLDQSLRVPAEKYSFHATSIFLLLLTFYLIPIIGFNSVTFDNVIVYNKKLFKLISYLFIILGIASYLYFIPVVYKLFSSPESILILRTNLVGGEVYVSINLLYYILTLFSQFYPIVILFYFESLSSNPEKIVFNRLLLFSSTSYIINVLSSMGRDGFVLWGLSFIFTYILYKKQLPINIKKQIKKRMGIIFLVFFSIFFVITIGRFFRDDNIYFLFQFMLTYFVQQFGEFNQFVTVVKDIDVDISKLFPILKIFIHEKQNVTLLEDHFSFLEKYGFSKYVFKTFIGSIYGNLGLFFTFLIFIFSSLTAFIFTYRRKNKSLKFGKIIFFTLYVQIILHGIFYYKLEYTISNIYIILCLLLSIVFSYKIKYNTSCKS